MSFRIIAHRGFSSRAPENTIASLDLAIAHGFHHIEFDVRLTGDDVVVVIHDDTVDRTTNGEGAVMNMSLLAIRDLDAGAWFDGSEDSKYIAQRVPTFEEVLARYADKAHLYIELKSPEPKLVDTVATQLANHGCIDREGDRYGVPGVSIISFDVHQLIRSKEALSELPHGYLVVEGNATDVEVCIANGFEGMFPFVEALDSELMEAAITAGLRVGTWGASKPDDIRRARDMGAVGATADWPDAGRNILG